MTSDGDTQSPHVGHVTQGSEGLALPKHFMELHTNERVTAKSCLTMFFSSGVTEHLCFSSDGWKPTFGLNKVLRGSSYDVYKGQTVITRVRHVMRGTSVLSPTGLYISFDTLRARLARDLSRI